MNTEANIHNITDLPLEILNYLCTHLTWLDVVMLELAIPYLRMEQCGIHYDFKLKKLKQLIRQLRKLKRKQQKQSPQNVGILGSRIPRKVLEIEEGLSLKG